jgi:hypothetical protein
MRDGYVARWQGIDYEASPDIGAGEPSVRLYQTHPAPGFTELAPGRHRRIVPLREVERLSHVSEICTWRGHPFRVIERRGPDLLVEYTGGQVPVARQLGLDRLARGVYRRWIKLAEAEAVRDEVLVLL